MGSQVPLEHYGLGSSSSFSSLQDLKPDRDAVTEGSLDNDGDPEAVECLRDSYRSSLPLHGVGVDDTNGSSSSPYGVLTIEDVLPIESARARFLQIVADHFIANHMIEVAESETDYSEEAEHDRLNKRKLREVQYEGDPRFALPLMYVANMYETLVNEVNIRLASLNGIRERSIGVALEAAGGLYRILAKKFPKKGPCTYRRRELATSVETRTRFPELVIQDVKRVRFVVINGLDIVEKPNGMSMDDAEWFKRLTGRNEVAIAPQDYKFYSPRHKQKRVGSNSSPQIPGLPTFSETDSSTLAATQGFRSIDESPDQQATPTKHQMQSINHQPQFHPIPQTLHQQMHQPPPTHHFPQSLPDITNPHHSPAIPQHIPCLQPHVGAHMGGRMHIMVQASSPAKFCDECGAPYLRETSKFCSECGVKRLGI